jgi:hypothetical protein
MRSYASMILRRASVPEVVEAHRVGAMTHHNIAIGYRKRVKGDRAENLERAIHHHGQALEVFTRQDFPREWTNAKNALAKPACNV